MNKRLRLIASAVALFSLLVLVCAAWTKPAESVVSGLKPAAHGHQIYCAGPAGSVSYLAKVKPRLTTLGAYIALIATFLSLSRFCAGTQFELHSGGAANNLARPLWLINRSLLI
jgi:hypothetical protein